MPKSGPMRRYNITTGKYEEMTLNVIFAEMKEGLMTNAVCLEQAMEGNARSERAFLTCNVRNLGHGPLLRYALVHVAALVKARGDQASEQLTVFVENVLELKNVAVEQRYKVLLAVAFGPLFMRDYLGGKLDEWVEIPLEQDELLQLACRLMPDTPMPTEDAFGDIELPERFSGFAVRRTVPVR
jgi:hypothetical protein